MTVGPAEGFLERLEVARAHVERLAEATPPAGALTDADEPTGEQWEWGQVWGHIAEFPAYWTARLREVFAQPASADPVPFGRSRTDPVRLAAIEEGRGLSADQVIVPLRGDLDDVRDLLADMSAADWERHVHHQVLGEMDMPRALEVFLVGHLEEHAAQLEGLLPA